MARQPDEARDRRKYMTPQERHVTALEMIGDELTLVCLQLERIADHFCEDAKEPGAFAPPSSVYSPELVSGIVRSVVEQFSVGIYKYTNLADAEAELHRIRQSKKD